MLLTIALTLLTAMSSTSNAAGASVARFADLPDVVLSQLIANTPSSRWGELDRKVADLPWARKLLARPDLIGGWLDAFKSCPPADEQKIGARFNNLESLLSYPPFKVKEAGCEREILNTLVSQCSVTKETLPDGPCVRLARIAFPASKMAHLFDGISARADGAFLVFPRNQSIPRWEAKRKQAESQLVELISKP
jgi:hypothetical protein